jgi:adenylate cyclase
MRVPRTFAFVDLSGFTNYTAAFGDDAAGRILGAFRSLVREIASERGVRIAKWLGDGCMIVSVDQSNCIAFALELENRSAEVCAPLSLRVGIATGYALLFEGDDYIGSAVNMASRLCDLAGPSRCCCPRCSSSACRRASPPIRTAPVELRGFPGPIDVLELGGTPVSTYNNDTSELWTRTPFG